MGDPRKEFSEKNSPRRPGSHESTGEARTFAPDQPVERRLSMARRRLRRDKMEPKFPWGGSDPRSTILSSSEEWKTGETFTSGGKVVHPWVFEFASVRGDLGSTSQVARPSCGELPMPTGPRFAFAPLGRCEFLARTPSKLDDGQSKARIARSPGLFVSETLLSPGSPSEQVHANLRPVATPSTVATLGLKPPGQVSRRSRGVRHLQLPVATVARKRNRPFAT